MKVPALEWLRAVLAAAMFASMAADSVRVDERMDLPRTAAICLGSDRGLPTDRCVIALIDGSSTGVAGNPGTLRKSPPREPGEIAPSPIHGTQGPHSGINVEAFAVSGALTVIELGELIEAVKKSAGRGAAQSPGRIRFSHPVPSAQFHTSTEWT